MSKQIIVDITQCINNPDKICDFSSPLELDSRLLPYSNAQFVKTTRFDCEFRYVEPYIELLGDIELTISGMCDKCGELTYNNNTIPFDEVFAPVGDELQDCYYFSGNRIDITQAIVDNILLNLPTSLVCDDNCKGLCPRCGTNLNNTKCDCT